MARELDPKDAAEIAEFKLYLATRNRNLALRAALNAIIAAANGYPEPIHYKVQAAIQRAKELTAEGGMDAPQQGGAEQPEDRMQEAEERIGVLEERIAALEESFHRHQGS